jgi:hypothetical protein
MTFRDFLLPEDRDPRRVIRMSKALVRGGNFLHYLACSLQRWQDRTINSDDPGDLLLGLRARASRQFDGVAQPYLEHGQKMSLE